ncbi:hypothetical protein NP493_243g01063 [Ridgeia piscesae]|uniref:Protein Red n=1 Tax=Ridgeia piscesae TaxID=27915 RepID=A0AAD9NZ96_RIDPI|nr:hypothetical protein NP493_243g01063 [Ridgeia piscesae]
MMTPHNSRSSSTATSKLSAKLASEKKTRLKDISEEPEDDETDDAASRRRRKKMYYAKQHKLEEEREKELSKLYRDRAKERRDGSNNDYDQPEIASTTADYRAVAPDAKAGENYAERRKQAIQESKYLGGDMEHTHLVKGLDYALLEKVRAEICSKEEVEEEEMEAAVSSAKRKEREEEEEEMMQFKTKMGRNIFRTLFRRQLPERNELFLPQRMAYVIDLEDDFCESDIPVTLIRSKADCPTMESTTTQTANDIVINKLTQILSYLRQGRKESKKLKKKDKGKLKEIAEDRHKMVDEGIYGDVHDYIPSYDKPKEKDRRESDKRERERGGRDRDRDHHRYHDRDREHNRDRDRGRKREPERERETKRSYFEKPAEEEDDNDRTKLPSSAKELVQSINTRFASQGWGEGETGSTTADKKPTKEEERLTKLKKKMMIDSYAECYPGMMESADAFGDSDDEVDYTKMDQGNKKGPVGRWDFDTQEEYSTYMANKEALPKAAFQYGVKMADGRKTRRTGPKDEKAVLDREWQQIQNLIAKRKKMGTDGEPYSKLPKY